MPDVATAAPDMMRLMCTLDTLDLKQLYVAADLLQGVRYLSSQENLSQGARSPLMLAAFGENEGVHACAQERDHTFILARVSRINSLWIASKY